LDIQGKKVDQIINWKEVSNVSIIIPTYNGAQKLPLLLDKLHQQTYQDFELVVVVDGSTDDTIKVLTSYKCKFPNFKTIWQKNMGRSTVRNRGAAEASGDLFIFFDDDMLPEPQCVTHHVLHHSKHPGSILTGAQIDYNRDVSDFQLFKNYLSRKWSAPLIRRQGQPLEGQHLFLTGANFSIMKNQFQFLNGFEEKLSDTEDFDLAVRANKNGIKIFYDHKAFAWHNDKVTGESYIKRLREYYKSNRKLAELRPWLLNEKLLKLPRPPKGIKRDIFLQFCSCYWIRQLDHPTWVRFLPEFIRYRLYSYIVTANGVYFPEQVNFADLSHKE
jgi:glycosyltransferase involved in cell wall biosynthesis